MNQCDRYNQGGIGRWYWDYRDRAVFKHLGGGPILDAGCGDGITAAKICAVGMDLDRGDVRGSVYDIPWSTPFFGTVLLLEVIEHLERPWEAIAEIRRVLKPGGRLIVLFPHDRVFKIAWFLAGMWGEISRDRGHLSQWWPDKGAFILQASGFEIVTQRSIPVNWWPLALHHIIVGEKS